MFHIFKELKEQKNARNEKQKGAIEHRAAGEIASGKIAFFGLCALFHRGMIAQPALPCNTGAGIINTGTLTFDMRYLHNKTPKEEPR